MNEDPTKNISALDKVKQIKEQKEKERLEAEELSRQQEEKKIQADLEKAKTAQQDYEKLQQEDKNLKDQRKEILEQIEEKKNIIDSIQKSQEAATREIFADEDVKKEIFQGDSIAYNKRENNILQDIFGADNDALDAAKSAQRELVQQLEEIRSKIYTNIQDMDKLYPETTEGIRIAEQERVAQEQQEQERIREEEEKVRIESEKAERARIEREKAEKAEQERIKKAEREALKAKFSGSWESLSDFNNGGELRINDYEVDRVVKEMGHDKAKEVTEDLFTEQTDKIMENAKKNAGFDVQERQFKKIQEYKEKMPQLRERLKKLHSERSELVGKIKSLFKNGERETGIVMPYYENQDRINDLMNIGYAQLYQPILSDEKGFLSNLSLLERGEYGTASLPSVASMEKLIGLQQELFDKVKGKFEQGIPQAAEYFKMTYGSASNEFYKDLRAIDAKIDSGYQPGSPDDRSSGFRDFDQAVFDKKKQEFDAKEKMLKGVFQSKIDQAFNDFDIREELRVKFPNSTVSAQQLESDFNNFENGKRGGEMALTKMMQDMSTLQNYLDEPVSWGGHSWLNYTNKMQEQKQARAELETLKPKISSLSEEKRQLEIAKRNATLGFGNGKRDERIKEIDVELAKLEMEKKGYETLANQQTSAVIGGFALNLGYINYEKDIVPGMTLRDAFKKQEEKIKERIAEKYDPKKKELLEKRKSLANDASRKASDYKQLLAKEKAASQNRY